MIIDEPGFYLTRGREKCEVMLARDGRAYCCTPFFESENEEGWWVSQETGEELDDDDSDGDLDIVAKWPVSAEEMSYGTPIVEQTVQAEQMSHGYVLAPGATLSLNDKFILNNGASPVYVGKDGTVRGNAGSVCVSEFTLRRIPPEEERRREAAARDSDLYKQGQLAARRYMGEWTWSEETRKKIMDRLSNNSVTAATSEQSTNCPHEWVDTGFAKSWCKLCNADKF